MPKKLLCALFFSLVLSLNADAQGWAWAKSGGGDENDHAVCIATDASGNTYVTGYFNSTSITFGSTTLTNSAVGEADIFLVKYNASGAVVWAKGFGGTSLDYSTGVTTDAAGNVYIGGYSASPSLSFGSYTFTSSTFNGDYFIVKLNSSGTVLWATRSGDPVNNVEINSITVDRTGNIYATGTYNGSLHVGSTTLSNASIFPASTDIFIVKYNSSGTFQWLAGFGDTKNEGLPAIATDSLGYVYISGTFMSPSMTIGTTTLYNGGLINMFFAKYDAAGSAMWAQAPAMLSTAEAYSITADATGNVYVTGRFNEPSMTFGSVTITNAGSHSGDAFLLKCNTVGTAIWGKSIGGTLDDESWDVHTDKFGDVYIVGNYSTTITIGTTTLSTPVGGGTFLAKYTPAGSPLLAATCIPSYAANGYSISSNLAGTTINIAGTFEGDSCSFGSSTLYSSTITTYKEAFVAQYLGISTTSANTIIDNQGSLTIYPNPNMGEVTIQVNDATFNNVIIYDGIGKIVYHSTATEKEKSKSIDLSACDDGIYFITVSGPEYYSSSSFELRR